MTSIVISETQIIRVYDWDDERPGRLYAKWYIPKEFWCKNQKWCPENIRLLKQTYEDLEDVSYELNVPKTAIRGFGLAGYSQDEYLVFVTYDHE